MYEFKDIYHFLGVSEDNINEIPKKINEAKQKLESGIISKQDFNIYKTIGEYVINNESIVKNQDSEKILDQISEENEHLKFDNITFVNNSDTYIDIYDYINENSHLLNQQDQEIIKISNINDAKEKNDVKKIREILEKDSETYDSIGHNEYMENFSVSFDKLSFIGYTSYLEAKVQENTENVKDIITFDKGATQTDTTQDITHKQNNIGTKSNTSKRKEKPKKQSSSTNTLKYKIRIAVLVGTFFIIMLLFGLYYLL